MFRGKFYNLNIKEEAKSLRQLLWDRGWKQHRSKLVHDMWPVYEGMNLEQAAKIEEFHCRRNKQ